MSPRVSGTIRSLAIVTPFYPPHVGGVERYAQEFARAALGLGISVNIVTTDSVRRPVEATEDGGIRILRLPAHYLPVMGSHYPISLSGWQRAGELLRCDVVMAHTRFFMTTLQAAKITARRGQRICVVDHGSGPLRSSPRALALAALAYERAVTAKLKRTQPRFFAVSAASAKWLRTFGIDNAPLLPNSVAPRSIPPCRQTSTAKRLVVFFAGRLLPAKGVLELIDGVERFAGRGHAAELRIAGDGPLAKKVTARAESSPVLRYLGRVTPQEVEVELERASVFVHPSNLPEGLPTTLLEAGSAALPVISTAFGGSGEIIHAGRTGWIIPRGDAKCIATALEDLVLHPEEGARRGAELFRIIQENYTWPLTVRKFLAFVEPSPALPLAAWSR
jgi:glycosyltransferase involved in cell wall biosynthesis